MDNFHSVFFITKNPLNTHNFWFLKGWVVIEFDVPERSPAVFLAGLSWARFLPSIQTAEFRIQKVR